MIHLLWLEMTKIGLIKQECISHPTMDKHMILLPCLAEVLNHHDYERYKTKKTTVVTHPSEMGQVSSSSNGLLIN